MSESQSTLNDRAEFIAGFIGDRFLRLAWALRDLQDEQPDIFLKVADLVGLSRRKAYALARIARQFDGVPEERLYFIGWTKLVIVGRYLTDDNLEHLLQLAQQNTAHDLEVLLRGEVPIEGAKVVQLYLSPNDYQRLRAALIKHGAVQSGNGLIKMEAALMALVDQTDGAA